MNPATLFKNSLKVENLLGYYLAMRWMAVFSILTFGAVFSLAEDRVEGFRQHKVQNDNFDRARKLGFDEWLNQQKKWELSQKSKGKSYTPEDHAVKEDRQEDFKRFVRQEQSYKERQKTYQQEYLLMIEKRQYQETLESQRLAREGEFELNVARPRYLISKRAQYGAQPKYKLSIKSGAVDAGTSSMDYDYPAPSPSSGGSSYDEYADPSGGSIPPSVPFDQQMENNFPPPYFPEEDIPPPPPIDFDDSF